MEKSLVQERVIRRQETGSAIWLVSENPDFRNPDVAAVYWGWVCPVSAAALYQHDLRYEFLAPVIRNVGVGSYSGRDADLHPVKQSDGRAGRGNRSLNGYV